MPSHSGLPEQFGRYRILGKLGEGGMGAVYLAHDSHLGRKVALKVPHFTADDGPAIERFQREARLAASIDHPNLCAVHDFGEVDGVHYFTMPHVEGTPLSRLIRADKPWPPRAAVDLLRQVALALSLLHQKGIIHRDLKPSNIMVRKSGEPVLMDFGLARSYSADSRKLTRMGSPLGTPAYMSPEQVEADPRAIGPATDVYSLGVILYEMMTGQVPFEGPMMALFAQILHATPERPSSVRPGLDAAIDALCLKALAKKPAERFATMSAFAAALVRYARPVAAVADPRNVAPLNEAPPLLETAPTEGRRSIRPQQGPAEKVPPARRETESSSLEQTTVPPSGRRPLHRGWLLAVVVLVAALPIAWLLRGGKSETPSRSPSLRLVAVPEVTLEAGQRQTVAVDVERQDCAGLIELRLAEACPGIDVRSSVVSGDGNAGTVEVTVDAAAAPGTRTLRLLAIAGSARTEGPLYVTIRSPGKTTPPLSPSLRLLRLQDVTLEAGKSQPVKVEVERKLCEGPIELRLAEPVAGVTVRSGLVASGSNMGQLELTADADAAPVKKTVRLLAIAASARTEGSLQVTIRAADLGKEITNSLKMRLVLIPAGTFTMGSAKGAAGAYDEEVARHAVKISRSFYMGTTEVTKGQFGQFVQATQYKTEAEKADDKNTWKNNSHSPTDTHPVLYVSWNDAVKFCEWLSGEEKETYALPTEAEWEYACRAGSKGAYSFGDDVKQLGDYAWYGELLGGRTHPVGTKKPNAWGLYDMHGNAWEWCADGQRKFPKGETKDVIKDPKGPVDETSRVIRGGSWYVNPRNCRSANRVVLDAGGRSDDVGFRVVLRRAASTPSGQSRPVHGPFGRAAAGVQTVIPVGPLHAGRSAKVPPTRAG